MRTFNRNKFQALLALGVISSMTDSADAGSSAAVASEANGADTQIATPETDHTFKHSFYFRSMLDTPANRETLALLGEIEESQDDSTPPKDLIRRKTETYTFQLPEVNTGNPKLDVVLLDIIKNEIIAAAKPYVNKGEVPPADKLTWDAIIEAKYIAITTAGAADAEGSGFNAAFLKELAGKFSEFMKALGKDETGTAIMAKMITGRFSITTTHKYINGLPMVAANIEKWLLEGCTEEEQDVYGDAVEYLLKKLEEAKNPPVVETGSLF